MKKILLASVIGLLSLSSCTNNIEEAKYTANQQNEQTNIKNQVYTVDRAKIRRPGYQDGQ